MKFELNEVEHKNLLAFLARTDFKGNELGAISAIVTALNKPIKEVKPKVPEAEQSAGTKPESVK